MKPSSPKLGLLLLLGAHSSTASLFPRQQSCPQIHVFGARETTAPPGFGSAQTVVNLVTNAFPGTTSEAIDYPAIGGNNYSMSVAAGIRAVVRQTTAFVQRCPQSRIVIVGYSQGAQIMDDAFCGGPDGASLLNSSVPMPVDVGAKVSALIWMGNPRYVAGLPYNIGSARLGGFAARPSGFVCVAYSSLIQSYCDAPDPFCSKGNSTMTHQTYGQVYGQQALTFVRSKLTTTTTIIPNAAAIAKPGFLVLVCFGLYLFYMIL